MPYLALFLFLLALILFRQSAIQRKSSGLPGGRIIYTDTRNWGKLEKALYDPDLGLSGKPDYLVEQDGDIIPVEVKSSRAPETPYDSHIYQLAAYCLLVERTYGKRPPYGILHYTGRDFAVDYTKELESSLLDLMKDMQQSKKSREVSRSHSEFQRCQKCGFRTTCNQVLR
jgi:CRISPR-associated exonuclease Cas4